MNLGAKIRKKVGSAKHFPLFSLFLFFWNILEDFLQEGPEGFDGCDKGAFRSGVGRLHSRTEADHVEVRILAEDDGTLQTSMVYLDDAVLTKQLLILF